MTALLDVPIIPSVADDAAAVEQENAPASTSSLCPRSEEQCGCAWAVLNPGSRTSSRKSRAEMA